MQLEKGAIIAEHYRLVKHLGDGSFGNVWLAHNLLADIDVAVKFYGTLDQKGLEDFRNEFKVAYRLRHPNLLNISHFDVCGNCPYLVMPYCENGSLRQHVGHVPESEIWKLVSDVSCGLAFLHGQQPPIVHQDIKPDNILITGDGRYVISDFGISRSLRTELSRTNHPPNISGTLPYMGPERFSEKPLTVMASDVWSLGMTIYEVVTGTLLWEGMGGCVQLGGARIPDMNGVSPQLSRLVMACLSTETWRRPSASEICEYASAQLQHPPRTALAEDMDMHRELGSAAWLAREVPADIHRASPSDIHRASPSDIHRAGPSDIQRASPSDVHRAGSSDIHSVSPYSRETPVHTPARLFTLPDRRKLLTAAAAAMAAAALAGGALFVRESLGEERDFADCRSREDYEQFVRDHPHSPHVATARMRIASMSTRQPAAHTAAEAETEEKKQEKPQEPAAAMEARPPEVAEEVRIVVQEPSAAAAPVHTTVQTASLQPAGGGTQASDAAALQTGTQTADAAALQTYTQASDAAAFQACSSVPAYQDYLQRFPHGRYRAEAERAIRNLRLRNERNERNDMADRTGRPLRRLETGQGARSSHPVGTRPSGRRERPGGRTHDNSRRPGTWRR